MMCFQNIIIILCLPKVRHKIYTPFIHTSLTFGSFKQTDLNSTPLPFSLSLSPLSTYLSSLLPYLT